jgi:cytochrome c-type biogenesis protein CcmE
MLKLFKKSHPFQFVHPLFHFMDKIKNSNLVLRYLCRINYIDTMKKTHIILLVAIAAAIGALIMMSVDFSTYDTIESAKQKQGKFVHLIARIDKTVPLDYDPAKNPNYLSFTAIDSLGGRAKVVYLNTKPPELEHSERVVLKGKMQGDVFECSDILLKCPSKYKDDKKQLEKTVVEGKY